MVYCICMCYINLYLFVWSHFNNPFLQDDPYECLYLKTIEVQYLIFSSIFNEDKSGKKQYKILRKDIENATNEANKKQGNLDEWQHFNSEPERDN